MTREIIAALDSLLLERRKKSPLAKNFLDTWPALRQGGNCEQSASAHVLGDAGVMIRREQSWLKHRGGYRPSSRTCLTFRGANTTVVPAADIALQEEDPG